MDDTAKRIISSLDGRWKETESGLTGTDRGLLEGRGGGGRKRRPPNGIHRPWTQRVSWGATTIEWR